MKPETVERLENHVSHARNKHPEWIKSADYVVDVAEQEWGEVKHALRWEGRERAKEEAYDLMAVLVRFIEGDDL